MKEVRKEDISISGGTMPITLCTNDDETLFIISIDGVEWVQTENKTHAVVLFEMLREHVTEYVQYVKEKQVMENTLMKSEIQNNLQIMLPYELYDTEKGRKILEGYGGLVCIFNMDTGEFYSHTQRKEHTPVFVTDDGKLYENERSAIRRAENLLTLDPSLHLCVTFYGIALKAHFRAGLLKRLS